MLAPRVRKEMRMTSEFGADSSDLQVFETMFGSRVVQLSGRKVGMCRFYQIREVLQELLPQWSSLLAPISILAINEGMLEGTSFDALQKKAKTTTALNPDCVAQNTSTKYSTAEDVRALRRICKNALVLRMMVLMEERHKHSCAALVELSQPCHGWYGAQAKQLRDVYTGETWFRNQVQGAYFEHVADVFGLLVDPKTLCRIGLVTLPSPLQLEADPTHPAVDEDRSLCAQCASFAVALVRRRCLRGLWMYGGWPSRCTLLAASDPAVREATAAELLLDAEAFEAAVTKL